MALPSKSLVEFPARKCRLKNYVSIALEHKWYHMDVAVDRHDEHPLPSVFRMLDDIQDFSRISTAISSNELLVRLKLRAFVFIPNYVHDFKISHYAHNVNCPFTISGNGG